MSSVHDDADDEKATAHHQASQQLVTAAGCGVDGGAGSAARVLAAGHMSAAVDWLAVVVGVVAQMRPAGW